MWRVGKALGYIHTSLVEVLVATFGHLLGVEGCSWTYGGVLLVDYEKTGLETSKLMDMWGIKLWSRRHELIVKIRHNDITSEVSWGGSGLSHHIYSSLHTLPRCRWTLMSYSSLRDPT